LPANEKRDQDSYRLPRWAHDWLLEDRGTTPKAKHVEGILMRYITRKIARQRKRAQKK
jgi:hypothetical protein